jgi:hypothetical protein
MNDQRMWEAKLREALALEITFDESEGGGSMHKPGNGECGWFQNSLAGRLAAAEWLAQVRHMMEVRDHLRSLEPTRRRRLLSRLLWRR